MTGLLLLWIVAAAGWERPISVAQPGRVAVVLDRTVYAEAQADLGDLRVVDAAGGQVPFVLERAGVAPETRLQPTLINREFEKGRSESVTLDFTRPVRKHALLLALSGANFRRRVSVSGSNDGRDWGTLTDDAYVFAIPGDPPARFETVRLPENDRRYLQVTVFRSEGDRERFEISSVTALSGPRRVARTEARTLRVSPIEDPERRETQIVLDLGVRAQPFEEIRLEIAEPTFFRSVVVEGRRDAVPAGSGESAPGVRWVSLGEAALYRYSEAGRLREQTSLALSGRERALRLRVRNRDDRPLQIRSAAVVEPIERVVFEAAPGHVYRLRYGGRPKAAPDFDLARTAGDPATFAASATGAALGTARPLPEGADSRPWTERHPRLLWAGLVAAVAALGALTWRAVRAAP